jgi:DnaJ family protein C protein 19
MRRSLAQFTQLAASQPLLLRCAGTRAAAAPPQLPPGLLARHLHATPRAPSAVALVGGLTVAAGAMAARYALQAYEKAQGPAPPSDGSSSSSSSSSEESSSSGASSSGSSSSRDKAQGAAADGGSEAKADGGGGSAAAGGGFSFQKSWGAEMLAKRFYRGGFEEKMTRREAALILGVRESATPERVRDRHRKMLMLNHPDMGGSTFLAEKVRTARAQAPPPTPFPPFNSPPTSTTHTPAGERGQGLFAGQGHAVRGQSEI